MGVQRISSAWKVLVPGMSEVFCRVEISGVAAQRAETAPTKAGKTSIVWDEKVTLPVYEGAKELRLLLLSSGRSEAPPKTIANGGFYVEDIMASPSNCKWFELFAPGGSAGGTIKLSILYTAATTAQIRRRQSVNAETQMEVQTADEMVTDRPQRKSFANASEAAMNTDSIEDAASPQSKRRSISVHVGVGPSPIPSQRNSPLPTPLSSQRRTSRQGRTPRISEPEKQSVSTESGIGSESDPVPAATSQSLSAHEAASAGRDPSDTPATMPEELILSLLSNEENSMPEPLRSEPNIPPTANLVTHTDLEERSDSWAAASLVGDEAIGIEVDSPPRKSLRFDPALEELPVLEETSATEEQSDAPSKRARGIPTVLIFGATAVAAVLGALVLGRAKGGGQKKTRATVESRTLQSQADVIDYASAPGSLK